MIIFLYGENAYRINEKVKELKDRFIREINPDASAVYDVDASTKDAKAITTACHDGTLFARKKLVIINDWSSNKSPSLSTDLLAYAEKERMAESEDIFIFCDKSLKSDGQQITKISGGKKRLLTGAEKKLVDWLNLSPYSQELKNYSPQETITWIQSEFSKQGLKINSTAASLLPAMAGYDLWRLKNEINKLSAYSIGSKRKEISPEDIKLLVNGRFDPNIFALTDALGSKNRILATRLLEEQYAAGAAPEYLALMLGRHFRLLFRIKKAEAAGRLSAVKHNPFVIRKSASQAARFSELELKKISNQLLELEYEARNGQNSLRDSLIIWLQNLQ